MRPREKKLADSLIAAALGLLVVTPIFDVVLFITKNSAWGHVGFWTLTVGLLGGLVAIGAETWEFRREHDATKQYRLTLFEIGSFLTAMLFYLTSWVIRLCVGVEAGMGAIGGGEFACSLLGSLILLTAGWFGGELVDRFKIGLSEDPTAEAAARRASRKRAWPTGRSRPTE
jgi:uncharacterized membrane protein